MNMDLLKQQQNRGYVIAGGAAIIAFIAYFLPYISVSYLGTGASVSGATIGSWLWFEFLGVLVAIAVAAVLVFRNKAFGLSTMPVEKQIKYGRYALIGAGALALLIHLLFLLSYQSNVGSSLIGATTGFSVGLGFGWFLFLLAAIGMVVGAVMAMRQPLAAYAASQPQYGQYGQSYPGQSTQYPPYQQPYSTPDQPQYPPYQAPQQYPPQFPPQQYPGQQYPPQPQQPYQQPPQYPPSQPQQYPPTELQQPPQQYPPQR